MLTFKSEWAAHMRASIIAAREIFYYDDEEFVYFTAA